MANWKFTDDYATTYPALSFGLLDLLVFSQHTITGSSFTGTLDFKATGNALNVLTELLGVQSLDFTGTITATDSSFSVALSSADITIPNATNIPVVGKHLKTAKIEINNTTQKDAQEASIDDFSLHMDFADASNTVSGTLITQIPMSYGLFSLGATFENLGVTLSDLDFLLPSGNEFSSFFPTTLPSAFYHSGISLNLLSINLGLSVGMNSDVLSFAVTTLSVGIGIVNIPVYKTALYLNPLEVIISLSNFTGQLNSNWAIAGTLALYPYTNKTSPPSGSPDFIFEVGMSLPVSGNPFWIAGTFENPDDLTVAKMLQDMFGESTDLGISKEITIEEFDFNASADSDQGGISSFSADIGMSDSFGIFKNFSLEEISVSVAYNE